eukprot:4984698-Amphidinium_carterae.1
MLGVSPQLLKRLSADFLFGKTLPLQGESQHGILVAVGLPNGFALKAHGSFGAAPDDAVGETPFPVSFLRLRYLSVPSGYRKPSAQALERRATRKLQRLQPNSLEEVPLNHQCSETASAATALPTP